MYVCMYPPREEAGRVDRERLEALDVLRVALLPRLVLRQRAHLE